MHQHDGTVCGTVQNQLHLVVHELLVCRPTCGVLRELIRRLGVVAPVGGVNAPRHRRISQRGGICQLFRRDGAAHRTVQSRLGHSGGSDRRGCPVQRVGNKRLILAPEGVVIIGMRSDLTAQRVGAAQCRRVLCGATAHHKAGHVRPMLRLLERLHLVQHIGGIRVIACVQILGRRLRTVVKGKGNAFLSGRLIVLPGGGTLRGRGSRVPALLLGGDENNAAPGAAQAGNRQQANCQQCRTQPYAAGICFSVSAYCHGILNPPLLKSAFCQPQTPGLPLHRRAGTGSGYRQTQWHPTGLCRALHPPRGQTRPR